MVLALGSLIAMQAYWINNAVALREQQFQNSVNEALLSIAQQVEEREAMKLMQSNSWMTNNMRMMQTNVDLLLQGSANVAGNEYTDWAPDGLVKNASNEILPDVNLNVDTILAIDSSCHTIYQSTVCIQVNDSVKTFTITHSNKKKLEEQVINSREKMASKLDQVNELFFQFFGIDREMNERIDETELQAVIDKELGARNINTKYEYLVLNNMGMPLMKSEKYQADMLQKSQQVLLFPNDLFSEPNSLLLYFPNQKRFILSSLGFMSASSIVLIIIISLCFAYTIYVIFRQKKLSDMKTDFINNMTHELKTPVATISLASEMLRNESIQKDHAKLSRFAGVIHEENKRLGGQVEQVLQMAVLDKGEFKLSIDQVNVHEIVERLCDKFTLRLEEKGGTCNTDLRARMPYIQADETHFTNIITNLIDNAIKYSKEVPEVSIRTHDAAGGITIEVEDKGIGMNREQQKRVFEKFYRVPTGNIHNVKGFGLGLSYVKAMVEAHGGTVSLSSELLKGSTFSIFMPYKAVINQNN